MATDLILPIRIYCFDIVESIKCSSCKITKNKIYVGFLKNPELIRLPP